MRHRILGIYFSHYGKKKKNITSLKYKGVSRENLKAPKKKSAASFIFAKQTDFLILAAYHNFIIYRSSNRSLVFKTKARA